MKYPKKLIEVSLPLDDINAAASREKSIRHGHPSTLHLWWARRPLAAARAVLFAQLVNDPDEQQERDKLFNIIRELVKWENTNNEEVLAAAREEIRKSWRETCKLTKENPDKLPPFLDPFSGGGSIPLEAQRLGLEAHGSDLNPVAVMIGKALIEIPPKFANRAPVANMMKANEIQQLNNDDWRGATGLAEDVRRYGAWMRDAAFEKIGHLYSQLDLPKKYGGGKATVIAWLWARTVTCPNPACGLETPLLSSFVLSSKPKKEVVYLVPSVLNDGTIGFSIDNNPPKGFTNPKKGLKRGTSGIFECLHCKTITSRNYVAEQGKEKKLGRIQTAIVVKTDKGRIYLPPKYSLVDVNNLPKIEKNWLNIELSPNPRDVWCRNFGLGTPADLFTARQLVALTTFSDLVLEARKKVIADAKAAGWVDDGKGLNEGGNGATAYGDAVAVYLGFAMDKMADRGSAICSWDSSCEKIRNTFGRQAIPMVWDYAECNIFSHSTGNWISCIDWIWKNLVTIPASGFGEVIQNDATSKLENFAKLIISSDPPYYDNISYADLSDFFYVWLRHTLKSIFPDVFATLVTPKTQELIAAPYRHGGKKQAEKFFMEGMTRAIHNMAINSHHAFPVTIYYAFKQSEKSKDGTASTGWETFLEAVMKAGFAITGTWPMRTELGNRMVGMGTNALASSIILVCRKRLDSADTISRKQFQRELNNTLPDALEDMIGGKDGSSPIAPVDLAQAAIGPGMAVFSQYAQVVEADGTPMSIRTALTFINQEIDDYFTQAEGDMDADTRFCLDWFQQYGFNSGVFGEAEVLARAKGAILQDLHEASVIESGGGKIRLLKVSEYQANWNPSEDKNIQIWKACHYLNYALQNTSESRAGTLLAAMPDKTESIRQLAYHLYTLCERKGWAEEARVYNELITSWTAIGEASQDVGQSVEQQAMFGE